MPATWSSQDLQQLTLGAGPDACRLELDRHELLRRSHDRLGLPTMDAPDHDDPFTLTPPQGYRDRGHHDKEVRTLLQPCDTLSSKQRPWLAQLVLTTASAETGATIFGEF